MDQVNRPWWQGRVYLGVLLLFSILPLLWPGVAPLSDLPSHIASYAVSVAKPGSPIEGFYSFHWQLIGNLGVDLAVVPFAKLLGVELGAKVVVIAIPLLTVLGMIAVAREAHGRVPATIGFVTPLAYNYFFLFGFVNYSLSMALALLAFALWLRWGRRELLWQRAAAFALIAPTVWIAHAIGWILLCLMCGPAELVMQVKRRPLVPALVATALNCLPLLTVLILMAVAPLDGSGGMQAWFDARTVAKWAVALLRDRWLVFDLVGMVPIVAVLGLALIRQGGVRFAAILFWPATALLLAYVFGPGSINGSAFVSQRIMPYAAIMLLLAIDTVSVSGRAASAWAAIAGAFLVVRTAGLTLSALAYDRDWARELKALDHVEQGSAVAVFAPYWCRMELNHWYNPRIDHIGGFAVFRRGAFSNTQWTLNGLQLLRVRYTQAGAFMSDSSQLYTVEDCQWAVRPPFDRDLKQLPRDAFNYVWTLYIPPNKAPRVPWLTPIWSNDHAVLYRVIHSAPEAASSAPTSSAR